MFFKARLNDEFFNIVLLLTKFMIDLVPLFKYSFEIRPQLLVNESLILEHFCVDFFFTEWSL